MSNVNVKGSGSVVFSAYKQIREDLGINTYFIRSCVKKDDKELCNTFTLKEFIKLDGVKDPLTTLKAKGTSWSFEGVLQANRYKKDDTWVDGDTEIIVNSSKWTEIKA